MFSLLKRRPFNYSLDCEMYSDFRRFTLEGERDSKKGSNCITDTSIVDIGLFVYDSLGDSAADFVLGFKLLLH